jgi:predicted N-acyltransferase
MEDSGSTSAKSGWQAHHLIVTHSSSDKNPAIIGVMPLFIKSHSYGEYVFDWSWAEAYQRHGMPYYPKLINAIPFTPATGKRWGIDPHYEQNDILDVMREAIIKEASILNASSCHCLFPSLEDAERLKKSPWLQRTGYQYHWFNHGFQSFDDFLATMSSRKRKNINKERQKIQQQNITLTVKTGKDISEADWNNFYLFYQDTYMKRSGHTGYLSASFFPMLADYMPDAVVMVIASVDSEENAEAVAAALYFKDSQTLYGRYWGCKADYDSLHFEACYYQGIEYAIAQGLQRFDPGAQGEHKIQRGFNPIKTYSTHWIENEDFRDAIQKFLMVEAREVEQYIQEASQLLPFKKITTDT